MRAELLANGVQGPRRLPAPPDPRRAPGQKKRGHKLVCGEAFTVISDGVFCSRGYDNKGRGANTLSSPGPCSPACTAAPSRSWALTASSSLDSDLGGGGLGDGDKDHF